MSFLAPPIANFALRFGPAEYFSLSVFGLVIIASVSGKSILKGIVAGLLGLLLATVGADPISGELRFTFDQPSLLTGINLLLALIGLFAVAQVLTDIHELFSAKQVAPENSPATDVSQTRPRWGEVLSNWKVLLSSSSIGTLIGAIPGAGGSIAFL